MKFVFKDIGIRKINKTVDLVMPPAATFYDMGFEDISKFILSEVRPHLPKTDKSIECVPTDGLPDLVAMRYVIVYDGIRGIGNVEIFP